MVDLDPASMFTFGVLVGVMIGGLAAWWLKGEWDALNDDENHIP